MRSGRPAGTSSASVSAGWGQGPRGAWGQGARVHKGADFHPCLEKSLTAPLPIKARGPRASGVPTGGLCGHAARSPPNKPVPHSLLVLGPPHLPPGARLGSLQSVAWGGVRVRP